MSQVALGKKIPAFTSPATGDINISLKDFKGKKIVMYFYPKDNMPGCTTESQNFRDNYSKFKRAGAVILGISRDSVKTHDNFKAKHDFPFDLLSDKEEALCQLFDVIKEKKLYGKVHMGIERSTFLIDEKGVLKQEWRKVKVTGHVEEVLQAVKSL